MPRYLTHLLFFCIACTGNFGMGPLTHSLYAQDLTLESATHLMTNNLLTMEALAADRDGNVYVAGRVNGSFDYADGEAPPLTSPDRVWVPYLLKRNSAGEALWIRTLEYAGPDDCSGRCSGEFTRLTVAPDGSAYVGGYAQPAFDLDSGPGRDTVSGSSFILHFSPAGDQLATYRIRSLNRPFEEMVTGMTTDEEGNLYVNTYVVDDVTVSTPVSEVSYSRAADNISFFNSLLLRFSPAGAIDWSFITQLRLGSIPRDNIAVIDDVLHVVTRSRRNVDFNPGPGTAFTMGDQNVGTAMARYTRDGAFLSLRNFDGDVSFGGIVGVGYDADGNIYANGFVSEGTGRLTPNDVTEGAVFVDGPVNWLASYTPRGDLRWYSTNEGTGSTNLVVDAEGNVVMSGSINDGASLSLPVGNDSVRLTPPAGGQMTFVQAYDETGEGQQPFVVSTTQGSSVNNFTLVTALAYGPRGEAYAGGIFRGNLTFPDGSTVNDAGGTQLFLLKFSGLVNAVPGFAEFAVAPTLFPNPSDGELRLQLDRAYPGGKIEVFAADGRRVLQSALSDTPVTRITAGELPEGYYFLRVTAEERAAVLPFVLR